MKIFKQIEQFHYFDIRGNDKDYWGKKNKTMVENKNENWNNNKNWWKANFDGDKNKKYAFHWWGMDQSFKILT